MFNHKLDAFERVSNLVNNIGVLYTGKFDKFSEHYILSLILVNTVGLALVTKIVLPKLLASEERGGIINIGSESATIFIKR